MIFSESIN